MNIRIVDTTLRDGEQKAGIAFDRKTKIETARYLDNLGIYQIEAGIPAMKGEEKKSICDIAAAGLRAKISAWNRMNLDDIKHSIECGVDIIHISVPASPIQIRKKLMKDENWVIERLRSCIYFVKERSVEVTIGFEDASRANEDFIDKLAFLCKEEGVSRVRYADTLGILSPQKTFEEVSKIISKHGLSIEIHCHNDFGMAVANTISAIKAGAEYIDCTLKGIGERTGNCDYFKLIKTVHELF